MSHPFAVSLPQRRHRRPGRQRLRCRGRWCVVAFTLALTGMGAALPRDAAGQTGSSASASARRTTGGMPGGRFEISGGAGLVGGVDLGAATATLSGSGVPTGAPVTLFDTETTIEGGPRYEARVAWRLTQALQVEGGLAVNRTHLATRITNDFEQAPDTEASEKFTEYAIEAGLLLHLTKLTFAGGRARPFVTGGAGYLRQVHEGQTLIDTGQSAYAGGGLTVTLRHARRRAFLDAFGLRADARVNLRSGGFESGDDSGVTFSPSFTGGVFVRF
jgi:hypothetical protein